MKKHEIPIILINTFFVRASRFSHYYCMHITDDYDDPPLVAAELVPDDPEIDLSQNPPPTAPHASMVGTSSTNTTTTTSAPQQSQAPPPTAGATSTTTTTYTIPAPATGMGAATTVIRHLGRNPKGMSCPHCQRQMVTRVRDQVDCVTIVVVIILLFLFWPLFWLPFCVPACKTSVHVW